MHAELYIHVLHVDGTWSQISVAAKHLLTLADRALSTANMRDSHPSVIGTPHDPRLDSHL
jgi:hypothetical protein